MEIKCENCLFRKSFRNRDFDILSDYCCIPYIFLDHEPKRISLGNSCEEFMAKSSDSLDLLMETHPEKWLSFGTDKRTAHWKSTQKIQETGGKKYLPIYPQLEVGYVGGMGYYNGEINYTFAYVYAYVYYENGDYKIHRFRENLRRNK